MARPPILSAQEKHRLVLTVLRGDCSLAEAARQANCSATTIARWRSQFVRAGLEGLESSADAAGRDADIARQRRVCEEAVRDQTAILSASMQDIVERVTKLARDVDDAAAAFAEARGLLDVESPAHAGHPPPARPPVRRAADVDVPELHADRPAEEATAEAPEAGGSPIEPSDGRPPPPAVENVPAPRAGDPAARNGQRRDGQIQMAGPPLPTPHPSAPGDQGATPRHLSVSADQVAVPTRLSVSADQGVPSAPDDAAVPAGRTGPGGVLWLQRDPVRDFGYELRAGAHVIGRLGWDDRASDHAEAEGDGDVWRLRRTGPLRRRVKIVDAASGEETARAHMQGLLARGWTMSLADSDFDLRVEGFGDQTWTLRTADERVLVMRLYEGDRPIEIGLERPTSTGVLLACCYLTLLSTRHAAPDPTEAAVS